MFARSLALIAALAMVGAPALAQVTGAHVSGTVTDPSGAAIAGAAVRARNTATGLTRETTVGEEGTYTLPNLTPGTYDIEVSAPNSGTRLQRGVELLIGQTATIDVSLEAGGVREEVDVTGGGGEGLDTTKTEISQVVTERQIENLPISGRNFVDFVLLSPKVAPGRDNLGGGIQSEPNVGVGVTAVARISFGGQPEYNTFVAVDGVDNTQSFIGLQRSAPSQEVAQEFRIVNTTYSSEFGRGFGLVNIITKSGGNDLRGSIYT